MKVEWIELKIVQINIPFELAEVAEILDPFSQFFERVMPSKRAMPLGAIDLNDCWIHSLANCKEWDSDGISKSGFAVSGMDL